MRLCRRKEEGITLIALVITVIILLILAGVALSLITGQKGLFARANQAGYEYDKSAQAEAGVLAGMNSYLEQYDIYSGNGGSSGNNPVGNESWSKGTGTGYQSIRQNYYDSATFRYKKILNGAVVEANKPTGDDHDCELVLTGQGDATKNIYDMGGNCFEYTTESYSSGTTPYITRAGYCYGVFASYPAGYRDCWYGDGNEYDGFRATLYL